LTSEDKSIVVAERSGVWDGEGGGDGFPLFWVEGEARFGEGHPADEIIGRFRIEDLGSAGGFKGFELEDINFDAFWLEASILDFEFGGDGGAGRGDEGDGERRCDEAEAGFRGLGKSQGHSREEKQSAYN
jgi:hypothetical protein